MPEAPQILTEPTYEKGILFGDIEQPKQDIYEEDADPQYRLGTQLRYNDGRIFRYAYNGGVALVKGYMTQAEAPESRMTEIVQTGHAQVVGDEEINVLIGTGITLADNELTDGFLVFNLGTGIADIYKILANSVRATDTIMDVLLETAIRTAVAATDEMSIVKSRWRNVIVLPTTQTALAAGVPLIAVTINYYFWAQTGGPCPMIVDTGDDLSNNLGLRVGKPGTNAVAGAVGDPTDSIAAVEYGICLSGRDTAAEAEIVWLTLDK